MTVQTVTSTDMKNQIGSLIENALRGVTTIVQRYSRPAAVIISHDEWLRLRGERIDRINEISQRMDAGEYHTLNEVRDGLGG